MRKVLIIFILFCLILSFAACNLQEEMNNRQDEQKSLDTELEESTILDNENDNRDDIIIDGAFLNVFDAKQYDSSESSVQANHSIDIVLRNNAYLDEDAEEKIAYSDNGVKAEYTYKQSFKGWLYNDDVHIYRSRSNGMGTELLIDARTKNVIGYLGIPCDRKNGEQSYTREQRYEIAYDFLSEHVDDPENYKWDPDMGVGISFFWFYRYIGELKTCDYMSVAVDDVGTVYAFNQKNLGEMKNVNPIPEELLQSVYRTLEEEAKSIYRLLGEEGCTWSYEAEIDQLVRMKDGSLALDCNVQATITTQDGKTFGDGAWFIIPITESTVQIEYDTACG